MAEDPHAWCTFDMPYIEATIGMRSTIKSIFAEVEKHGGYVDYREHKGFFSTTYTHIHVEGERWVLRWMIKTFRSLDNAQEDR